MQADRRPTPQRNRISDMRDLNHSERHDAGFGKSAFLSFLSLLSTWCIVWLAWSKDDGMMGHGMTHGMRGRTWSINQCKDPRWLSCRNYFSHLPLLFCRSCREIGEKGLSNRGTPPVFVLQVEGQGSGCKGANGIQIEARQWKDGKMNLP